MSYRQRLSFFILADLFLIITSFAFSFWLLTDMVSILLPLKMFGKGGFIAIVLFTLIYFLLVYLFKLHRKAWEHVNIKDASLLFLVTALTMVSLMVIQLFTKSLISLRLLFIFSIVFSLLNSGVRFFWKVSLTRIEGDHPDYKRTLIIGAGSAGTMLVRHLITTSSFRFHPVAFIDDDSDKQKLDIYGVPVAGTTNDIELVVSKFNIERIILAIPSLKKHQLNEILTKCVKTNIKTQKMPMLEDIIEDKRSFNDVHDIQFEDLLGRDPVILDDLSISDSIAGKVILVTGAGGSIGSEICRQAAKFKPGKMILLGHGENSIYNIDIEMQEKFGEQLNCISEIADIKNREKIFEIIGKYQPDIIYHAAAHKHVHLMEWNPDEALKNNVIGTKNLVEASHVHKVGIFVMISTDKAVNSTGVMGSSKRLAEMIVQDFNAKSKTKFVAVRFGNVLGSRGSAIPLFIKQIKKGGPITVTHPDMVRYFMTIPEAARLVIQAGALAKGGEIFILDMGNPVKIVDLVHNLIRLSGYKPEEIEITFTGIRPGEKLFEELLASDELIDRQVHSNIYIGKGSSVDVKPIEKLILEYKHLTKEELRKQLLSIAGQKSGNS